MAGEVNTTTETIDLKQLEWFESALAERGPHDATEYFSDEDRVLDLLNREEVAHMRTKVNLQDAIARAERAEAFIADFAEFKFTEAPRPYVRDPQDEPDQYVDAQEVWSWQSDAKELLK